MLKSLKQVNKTQNLEEITSKVTFYLDRIGSENNVEK